MKTHREALVPRLVVVLLFILPIVVGAAPLDEAGQSVQVEVVAEGLAGPDGLALHPGSGELYVAEKAAARVSIIREGRAVAVIENAWGFKESVPAWAVTPNKPRALWDDPALHAPGSIAFSADARLFIAEDRANGRLLEFLPGEDGLYTTAQSIAVPWMDRPFAWGDLRISGEGDLYLTGDVPDLEAVPFGSILRRDPSGIWWVVDFGPFVRYVGLGLSRDDDMLVVCERRAGSVIWWDTVAKVSVGTAAGVLEGPGQLDGAVVLWDGSLVLPVNSGGTEEDPEESGYLLRIDPVTREQSVLASGFGRIGSILPVPSAKVLYVSEPSGGRVLLLRPDPKVLSPKYLLERPRKVSKGTNILPPKQSAMLIGQFMDAIQEGAAPLPGQGVGTGDRDGSGSFTFREFVKTMPTVAGKVTTTPSGGDLSADPVESIEFLICYPSRVIRASDMATPSLSFFLATRRSGKVEKTRLLLEGIATGGHGTEWEVQSEEARVYVPLAVCNMETEGEDTHLNINFLGLGLYEDYHLRLVAGSENSGTLLVDNPFGSQTRYDLHFAEEAEDGRVVRDVQWQGFEDKGEETEDKAEDLGWFQIGKQPVGTISTFSEEGLPKFKGVGEELHRILEEKEMERRLGQ